MVVRTDSEPILEQSTLPLWPLSRTSADPVAGVIGEIEHELDSGEKVRLFPGVSTEAPAGLLTYSHNRRTISCSVEPTIVVRSVLASFPQSLAGNC